ncbi:MAG: DUF92 domain-containing protein [Bacteroidota bacterium]
MLYVLAAIVLSTTLVCETAAKRGWLPYWVSRKILHIVAVGACAVATTTVEHRLLIPIVAVAEVALVGLVASGSLMRDETGRPAWGIIWFPLAFLLLLISKLDPAIAAFSMWTLAICDPAATITGKLLSKDTYQLTGDQKSLPGNVAFLISFILLYLFLGPEIEAVNLTAVCMLGIILAAAEAVGSKGLDNLTVPLFTAFLLHALASSPIDPVALLLFVVFTSLIGMLPRIRRSLTGGGIVTAALLALVVIVGSRGVEWLLPLVLFFGSRVLVGKLFPGATKGGDEKQKQARNATQVLANGGVYGLIILSWHYPIEPIREISHNPISPFLLLSATAIATADTWSSEVGQHYRSKTYNLLTWQAISPGLSGGISLPGTLAGLAGAAFIGFTCYWLLPYPSVGAFILITLFGFAGMLIDSLLGALLQAKYEDPETGAITDASGHDKKLVAGFRWMTNDLVNFLAILIGVWLATYLYW